MRGPAEKKTEGKIMKRQLSLVELATYGYTPARVNKGSWLEQTFGSPPRRLGAGRGPGQADKDLYKNAERGFFRT